MAPPIKPNLGPEEPRRTSSSLPPAAKDASAAAANTAAQSAGIGLPGPTQAGAAPGKRSRLEIGL